MLSGAVFDIDGTLLDSLGVWDNAADGYLRSIGIESPDDTDSAIAGMSLEESAVYLKRRYDIPLEASQIVCGVEDYISKRYISSVRPKDGAAEFLARLKEHGVAVSGATSGYAGLITQVLDRFGISPKLGVLLSCTELGVSKRTPEIYIRAAEIMKTPVSETAVFEDSLFAAKAAKSAGFLTVGIYDKHNYRDTEELKRICDLFLDGFNTDQSIISNLINMR